MDKALSDTQREERVRESESEKANIPVLADGGWGWIQVLVLHWLFLRPVYFCHTNVCFYYNTSLFSFNFPVDEYEEECVPSGGFAYEKVSKNLHLISADPLFLQRLPNEPVSSEGFNQRILKDL